MPRRPGPAAGRRRSPRAGARLVFEIGTEELPPQAAWDGARQLAEQAPRALESARIAVRRVTSFSTPRRLVLIADDVQPRQRDLVREVRGPAVRVAYDAHGRPTAAAEGFARGQGVPVSALERRVTPQGEYVYAVRREPGAAAAEVLRTLLPELAAGLTFPKAMRWGTGTVRFARPVRWLVALLGSRVIACEFAGVAAGRRTYGHRILHPAAVPVPRAGSYEAVLKRSFVLLDPEERRRRVADAARKAAGEIGGRVVLDADLLDETVQLVEWPEAFVGRFADEFLALPREVLITVMQHHQKYFAVEDAGGALLPAFVGVRNGDRRGLAIVREGNEWVLRARLADGRFFFEEDRKRRLADRVQGLQDLVFLDRLGTMADKTVRLERLAGVLARLLHLAPSQSDLLRRAAHLSKADLITQVVRELPELQGVMGGIYARLDGEPAAVADAIREQYLPRGAVLPSTPTGAYLALADKADTLLSALAAGMAPSGSQDPYGLRRAAAGIVAIILRRGMRLSLADLARGAGAAAGPDGARVLEEWQSALRQRLRAMLIDEGISYDTVDAALDAGADDLVDAAARARALWEFRRTAAFAGVYTAFDRAARILPDGAPGPVREDLCAAPAERALLQSLRDAQTDAQAWAALGDPTAGDGTAPGADELARRYRAALERLAALAAPVDRFFEDVLVMDPDEGVRQNRLALLAGVVALVRPIADLSRVVVGEGKAAAPS